MNNGDRLQKDKRGGMFRGIADHLVLVWRLWTDSRVNFLLKLLPLGSLVYLVSPFDLPTPIDDVGVIWAFTYLFIEMCPPHIVAEHRAAIEKRVEGHWKQPEEEAPQGEIIDAEFRRKE